MKKRISTVLALLMAAVFGLTLFAPAVTSYAAGETETAAVEEPEKEQVDQPYEQSVTVNKNLKVTAKADAGILPDGAKLKVEPITKGDDYKDIEKKVREDAEEDDKELSGLLAYDISFEADGKEVEPDGKVDVTMKWDDAALPDDVEKDAEVSVLHLTDDDKVVDLTESEDKNNTAEVKTEGEKKAIEKAEMTVEGFSVFAVAWEKSANAVRKAAPASTSNALDVSSYITAADISYVTTDSAGKEKTVYINDNTEIPDTVTKYEINVTYAGISTQDLREKYGKTIYYTLPSQLINPTVASSNVVDAGNNTVGMITAQNNSLEIVFTDDHVSGGNAGSTTSGTFRFRCEVDRTNNTNNPMTISIGNVSKTLKFQVRDIAETGELNIAKSNPVYYQGTDAANEGYLEYTLTVSTGNDAMPEVKVEDSITSGSSYVDGYLVAGTLSGGSVTTLTGTVLASGSTVTVSGESGKSDTRVSISGSNPGTMTWTIGNMAAHETRTLTYRIKLNKDYVGVYNRTGLTNTATPYSKQYSHGQASKSFTPHEEATVNKTVGNVIDNPTDNSGKGTVTIPYTVTITADANNTWPIRHAKINDHLQGSYNSLSDPEKTSVREALCKYARFTDFKIMAGNTDITSTIVNNNNPITYYGYTAGSRNRDYNPSFDIYVGDVAPGTTQTITYNLVIDKTLFTTLSRTWNINNNVSVHTDDSKLNSTGYNASVGSGNSNQTIGTQVWDRKVMGSQLTSALVQDPAGRSKKTVPAGAIKYQVVVNETGKWDLSQATLTDTLGDHLQYTGYLQIDYYETGISYDTKPNDSTAITQLQKQLITSTVYKDIDDIDNDAHTSFTFSPTALGLTQKKGAYLLTYYAVPVNTSNMSSFQASNSFSVSGSVIGPGGSAAISMSASSVSETRVISGGANFSATKRPWYYDSYNNKAYWVIELSGNFIPQGLALKDVPGQNNNTPSYVGAYIGTVDTSLSSDSHLSEAYKNYPAFQKTISSSSLTALTADTDFTISGDTFTFKKNQALSDNQKIYIIVTTQRSLPSGYDKRTTYELQNKLQMEEASETSFRDVNTASLSTKGGGDIFKELGEVVSRDSSGKWTQVTSGKTNSSQVTSNLITSKVNEAGTYIEWRIKVNMLPNLSGTYEVTDTLPEGVEPVYVWYFWIDSSINTAGGENAPTMPAIADLDSSWTDIGLKDIGIVGNTSVKHDAYAYYNESTRQIRFNVGNLKSILPTSSNYTSLNDKRSLEVQVLVKVTDPEFLAGIEKTYTNSVTMKEQDGADVGQDTSGVTTKKSTITKSRGDLSGGKITFTLNVNPLGEDLANGASTLTIVDELSDPLICDLTSIKVKDASNNDITDYIIQDGGKTGSVSTIRFIVPNNQKLTITYDTKPYVQPNATFNIKNTAYWSGSSGGSVSVDDKNIKNSVGGTSTTDHIPEITVKKHDADNISTVLSGATFKLTKVIWNGTNWVEVNPVTSWTQTTGANGEAVFSSDLEYNTAYKLEETSAPNGYEADSIPKYIVVAKSTGTSEGNPTYPADVTTYADQGAIVQYTGDYKFSLDVSNTPKDVYELSVNIKKVDSSNTSKALSGAKFRLYRMNGSTKEYYFSQDSSTKEITWSSTDTPNEFTTDSKGQISLTLPRRKSGNTGYAQTIYYLEEITAPDGYNKLTKPVSFMVNSSGEIAATTVTDGKTSDGVEVDTSVSIVASTTANLTYTITVTNTPGTPLPEAGGTGTRIFTVLGLLLIFTAGILLGRRGYLRRHRTKN